MMRMKKIWTLVLLAALAGAAASSCGKDEPTPVTPEKPDTPVTPDPPKPKVVDYDKYALKEVAEKAGLKLGVSFTYDEYQKNPKVAEILKRDFAAVTFGNEMKHDAIVQQGGAYYFTRADQMAGWAKTCGAELFGHTLGWHSQQQRTYLNNLISKAARNNGASLLQRNWNFEAGTLDGFQADGFEVFQSLYDVFAGDYAAKAGSDGATLTVDASLEAGKPYTFSCWAKTLAKEGALGVTSGDGQSAQTKVSSQWYKYEVPFTLESPGDFAFRITASKDVVIDNVRILGEGGGGQQPTAEVIDFEGLTAGPLNSPDISAINGADYVRVTGETAHGGSLSLKMDNSSGYAQNAWSIQVLTKSFAVTPGTTYRLSWYAKASRAADFQIDVRGDGDVKYFESKYNSFPKAGTDWTYQSVEFTVASGTELSFAFYGGVEAVTYYLDDIRLAPASTAASAPRRRAAPAFSAVSSLNGELVNDVIGYVYRDWVYTMVGHFDAYGWDVVNETFSDWPAGAFRTPQNTSGEVFVWGQYFKSTKDWVDKAFAYATDALRPVPERLQPGDERRQAEGLLRLCEGQSPGDRRRHADAPGHGHARPQEPDRRQPDGPQEHRPPGPHLRTGHQVHGPDRPGRLVQVHLPAVPGNRPGRPARRHHHLGDQRQGLLGEAGAGRPAEHAAPVPGRQLRPQTRLEYPLPLPLRARGVGSL